MRKIGLLRLLQNRSNVCLNGTLGDMELGCDCAPAPGTREDECDDVAFPEAEMMALTSGSQNGVDASTTREDTLQAPA